MQIINQGIISVPEEWKDGLRFVLRLVNIDESKYDIDIKDGEAVAYIEEYYGDIEESLERLVDLFVEANILINMNIVFYGDYNGMYKVEDNEFVMLDQEDMTINEMDDKLLITEIERRGYSVLKNTNK